MNSVRHRLVLVVAIGLAPILAFLGHTELEARRVRHQLMQEEALRLVRLVAYDEQRIIGDAEQTLNVISGGPSVKRGLLSLCQQFLQNIVQESPRYVDVTVIGTDGRVTCAPDPTQIGIDLSDRVYFRDALLKNETIVGEYSIGPTSKVPSIAIAKRFTDQAGTIAGVVEVSLNLDWVQRQVEQLDLPEGATAGFTDRSGIILARQPYNPSIVGHPILAANRFILEGDKIEVRSNIQTRDGRELMLAYMPPGGQAHGLGISVGLDPRITFAEITRANRSGVLFILLSTVLSLGLTLLAGNRFIGRPINQLLEAAANWRTGNFKTRTQLRWDGTEFGRLGGALDDMADALQIRERRLRDEVAARENAQARAERAERLHALGQLAGGIAHDFNNVLHAISGTISLIENRAGENTGITQLCALGAEAVDRGASITARLLAFGRRSNLRVEAIDIATMFDALQELFRRTLGTAVIVETEIPARLPRAKADRHQLETVMVNLATNARDAMPGGGRLVLSADVETIEPGVQRQPDMPGPGAYIRLRVADNGTGMDASTQAKAREPFFTTKDVGAGTGLGLSMAQGFAEQSGGALSIQSRTNVGTMVTLWLPLATEPAVVQTLRSVTEKKPRQSGRIILADDDSVIRKVVALYLEDAGYDVTIATDGMQALFLMETTPAFDAIITDLSMPGMDGISVIRAMRERFPSMPAVLITGYATDETARTLMTTIAKPVSLLRKPVSRALLLDCLQTLLNAGGSEPVRAPERLVALDNAD